MLLCREEVICSRTLGQMRLMAITADSADELLKMLALDCSREEVEQHLRCEGYSDIDASLLCDGIIDIFAAPSFNDLLRRGETTDRPGLRPGSLEEMNRRRRAGATWSKLAAACAVVVSGLTASSCSLATLSGISVPITSAAVGSSIVVAALEQTQRRDQVHVTAAGSSAPIDVEVEQGRYAQDTEDTDQPQNARTPSPYEVAYDELLLNVPHQLSASFVQKRKKEFEMFDAAKMSSDYANVGSLPVLTGNLEEDYVLYLQHKQAAKTLGERIKTGLNMTAVQWTNVETNALLLPLNVLPSHYAAQLLNRFVILDRDASNLLEEDEVANKTLALLCPSFETPAAGEYIGGVVGDGTSQGVPAQSLSEAGNNSTSHLHLALSFTDYGCFCTNVLSCGATGSPAAGPLRKRVVHPAPHIVAATHATGAGAVASFTQVKQRSALVMLAALPNLLSATKIATGLFKL
ncbi:unnamed protein product [Amoebophrya sp. A120]|nr:unnamed protein product [Amoebophrya sp. A120]|eukprot:GSA120T00019051001.1